MIQSAIDISLQIGWDTHTDLELAHRFIEERKLTGEFVSFLKEVKAQDEQQLCEEEGANSAEGDCC